MTKYEVTIHKNGKEEWRLNGERHRVDGPAVTYADGYEEYWLNGHKATKKEVMGHTITIDDKTVSISKESYLKLKETIK